MHSQNGWGPLHEACQKGYDGIVVKLLQAGATVDLQEEVGIAVGLQESVRSHCNEPSDYDRVLRAHKRKGKEKACNFTVL